MNMAGEPRVRILIVDDHPMVREGRRGMLSTASNLEVVGEAGTAHDAVVQAEALQPDVILLDIQLPDMDGVTALPQLKSVAATARVLMVTIHEETAYMLQAIMAGAAGYILKGVDRHEVVTASQLVRFTLLPYSPAQQALGNRKGVYGRSYRCPLALACDGSCCSPHCL